MKSAFEFRLYYALYHEAVINIAGGRLLTKQLRSPIGYMYGRRHLVGRQELYS